MVEQIKQNTPDITAEQESREKRLEVIQDIRDKYGILFISCQPIKVLEGLGFKGGDEEWFRKGLGLPEGTDRLKVVHAVDEPLPNTIPEQGVIIGGSVHSVYEKLPWIDHLKELIVSVAKANKPLLGVCFGHQLIVETFGGKVEKGNSGREFGVTNIDLTKEGLGDPLFESVAQNFVSATSHGDTVTKLPDVVELAELATNTKYPYQALGLGERIRSVQFHPEADQAIMEVITRARQEALIKEGVIPKDELQEFIANLKKIDSEPARQQILRNFDRNFVVRFCVRP